MDTPGASALIDELAAAGCKAVIAACDVADSAALEKLLGTIPDAHPLTGVFHSAAVLDGGLAMSLTSDNIAHVFMPKVKGAWNLHLLTQQHRSLAVFVMFSSVAGLVGSEGQGAYAAANTFLDALSQLRHNLGLPAQALAWGPWAEIGMAARLSDLHQDRMRRAGFISISPAAALEELDRAMQQREPLLVPVELDEDLLRREGTRPWLRALFPDSAPTPVPSVVEKVVAKPQTLRQRLDAATVQEREHTLVGLVRAEVAAVLRLQDAERVQLDQPLQELGMDSLMAVDIRRRLEARLSMQLPATLVFDCPSCGELLEHLLTSWNNLPARTP
jgi:acyl carrier protein